MRYRKKPVVIEAIQFVDNDSAERILAWAGTPPVEADATDGDIITALYVDTIQGLRTARLSDWVLKGVKGEFYPIPASIFDATYEPA